jgi:hypothetical protein
MGLITQNFDAALSILARVHGINDSHPGRATLDGREVSLEKLHGTLPDTFEPQEKKKARPLPDERPRSANCLVHRNREFALMHAKRLEKLTGDRCKVMKYKTFFKIVRHDTGGKKVLNGSY